jgi:hypothetical protein
MKRAAAMLASGRNQGAAFEARPYVRLVVTPGSTSPGNVSKVGATTHADLIAAIAAAFFSLLVQAALAFQKYHFNNGLILGVTMVALSWYEDTARRNGLPRSRVSLILIATSATALTVVLQQAACLFATSALQSITHS